MFTIPVGLIQTGIGGAGIVPAAFRSSASNTLPSGNSSMTITKPSGVVSGDLLVFIFYRDNNQSMSTPPSGWTLDHDGAATIDGQSSKYYVSHKVAGGSEPANYTWTFGGGTGNKIGVILAYQDGHATQIDTSAVTNPAGTSTDAQVSDAITTAQDSAMVVVAWMMNRTGTPIGTIASISGSMTQRHFSDLGASALDKGLAIYDKVKSPTAAGSFTAKTLTMTNTDVSSIAVAVVIRAAGT